MPVHREKEPRQPKVTSRREASTSRSTERQIVTDRPIITQSKSDRKVRKSDAAKPEKKKVVSTEEKSKTTKVSTRTEAKHVKPETHRLRTRTRTLSPTEVKQLTKENMMKQLKKVEKEMEVKRNRAEVEKVEVPVKQDVEDEEEYEDDFEDYESDFEEDSEEEKAAKPKTPTPEHSEPEEESQQQLEISTKPKKYNREIEEIKLAMKMENEIAKSRRSTPEPVIENEKVQILDFTKSLKKSVANEAAEKIRRRGRDLLNMITLDVISYSFLDIPSVPYEVYMRMYGKSNTKQVHVQTNEDDLDEETQTDYIDTASKWVQNPPEVAGIKYRLTKEERLGVGSDTANEEPTIVINTNGLKEFLRKASNLVIPVLQRRAHLGVHKLIGEAGDMHFSDGFFKLNVPFVKGKSVVGLCCSKDDVNTILSVHTDPKSFGESILCLWSVNDLTTPMKVLTASNRVTSVCTVPQSMVFAGLADGTVCLWDLREPSSLHNSRVDNTILRSPTYTTAHHQQGHVSSVTSIHVIRETEIHSHEFTPIQVSSLEEKGTVIIWSVVLGQTTTTDDDLGLAHWGKVKLVRSSAFSVLPSLGKELPLYVTCNSLALEQTPDVELFVSNSMGTITHLSRYGTSMKPKAYVAVENMETTCLEMCPFDSNYFLAGCKDGSIRLHSRHQELPLISLNGNSADEGPQASIVSLAWLFVKPFVFFALDSLSRIHVWDLGLSDMYPEVTLNLMDKKINCVKLVQSRNHKQRPHFVLGTADGVIEIHRLLDKYCNRSAAEIHKDVKKFLKMMPLLDWWKPLRECRSLHFASVCCVEPDPTPLDSDDDVILESKVVTAIMRLQGSSFNPSGISHCKIVDYLTKRYPMDGDVESQVLTALQMGVKKGLICTLRNGKYSLVGLRTETMISNCFNRVRHGPGCLCSLTTSGKRECCSFAIDSNHDFVKSRKPIYKSKRRFLKRYKPCCGGDDKRSSASKSSPCSSQSTL